MATYEELRKMKQGEVASGQPRPMLPKTVMTPTDKALAARGSILRSSIGQQPFEAAAGPAPRPPLTVQGPQRPWTPPLEQLSTPRMGYDPSTGLPTSDGPMTIRVPTGVYGNNGVEQIPEPGMALRAAAETQRSTPIKPAFESQNVARLQDTQPKAPRENPAFLGDIASRLFGGMHGVPTPTERTEQKALVDVTVPGSSTTSTNPLVAGPPQSEAAQRTNVPTTSTDREAYQMDDAAKAFTMIPDERRDTSTAMDASGNYMQGVNKPGGTFNVMRGDRGGATDAEWEAMNQEERTKIRVASIEDKSAKEQQARANAQVKAYQSGTGPLTRAVADALKNADGSPSPGSEAGSLKWRQAQEAHKKSMALTPAQQFASDMNDYNSGRVGSEGYSRMRNMRMKQESAARAIPRGKARDAALANIAANPFGDMVESVQKGNTGLSDSAQLGLARLGLDTQFKSQEAQRKAQADQYARQKDAYQMKRDAAKDDQELRSNAIEASEEILESGGRFAEGLYGLGPELLRRSARKGIDPYSAMDAMNALLAEDTPVMENMRKSLMDSNVENQQKAQAAFAKMFARKQGWNQ